MVKNQEGNNTFFQYAATVVLNHEQIRKHPERVIKLKHFIREYNGKGIIYPSEKDDWRKFEKNNPTIALNILCEKKKNGILSYLHCKTQFKS